MIPLLADHPGDIAFEVVCPSIPGYGYSDTPKRMGEVLVKNVRCNIYWPI